MPEDVQPTEGQGGEATEGGLFDSYLQAVPEDARETVASYLKDAEKNVNSRLQEAAEYKKTWEPFQQVRDALTPYAQNPEVLSERLGWLDQVTSSPEAYQQWLAQEAEQAGFTKAEAQELQDAEDAGELSQERIQQIIDQRVQQQLGPLQQQQEELARARTVDTIEQDIHSELTRLEKESGETFSEPIKKAILDLGEKYEGDESWVQYGYDRLKEAYAQGAKAFVTDKSGQPQAPLSTGGQAAFKPPTTFDDANKMFRERLRQQQS